MASLYRDGWITVNGFSTYAYTAEFVFGGQAASGVPLEQACAAVLVVVRAN